MNSLFAAAHAAYPNKKLRCDVAFSHFARQVMMLLSEDRDVRGVCGFWAEDFDRANVPTH